MHEDFNLSIKLINQSEFSYCCIQLKKWKGFKKTLISSK